MIAQVAGSLLLLIVGTQAYRGAAILLSVRPVSAVRTFFWPALIQCWPETSRANQGFVGACWRRRESSPA